MIADSDYEVKALILPPAGGLVAGLLASVAMLAVLSVLSSWTGLNASDWMRTIGQNVGMGAGNTAFLGGFGLHLLTGAILGALYAMSQQSVPRPYLFVVGAFYGFVLWIVSGLILGLFSEAFRLAFRNGAWFIACLTYGLALAACAAWSQAQHSGSAPVVAKD